MLDSTFNLITYFNNKFNLEKECPKLAEFYFNKIKDNSNLKIIKHNHILIICYSLALKFHDDKQINYKYFYNTFNILKYKYEYIERKILKELNYNLYYNELIN